MVKNIRRGGKYEDILHVLFVGQLVPMAVSNTSAKFLFGSWKENVVAGRIFKVAFLLFIAPAGGSSPAGQSLTFTSPKITFQKLL